MLPAGWFLLHNHGHPLGAVVSVPAVTSPGTQGKANSASMDIGCPRGKGGGMT